VPVSHEAPSPEGIGETAIGAAMMRARETVRAAGLFSDPYAAAFVAAAPPVFEGGPDTEDDPELDALEAAFEDAVVVRTRFFDDFGADATRDGCT
jgi:O-methyltransferase involved in polyketide biosynthesis